MAIVRSESSTLRTKISVVLLAVTTILATSACVRPKRFRTLNVVPFAMPKELPGMEKQRGAELLQAFTGGFSTLRVGDKVWTLDKGPESNEAAKLIVGNVSAAEPTSTPVSAYFTSGPEAQAEIVKLYAQLLAKDSKPPTALRTLFDLLFDSNAKVKANPYRFRSELTITHSLSTLADWDRISIFMVALIPHDPELRIVDTNQLESIIKDLEIGTLTQTGSAEASISAKRTLSDVIKIDPLTETRGSEFGPSAKMTYTEQLQRKLREQLAFRSSSIEKEGSLFRLTYRTNGSEQVPAMTRQVLTFEYRPEDKVSLLLFDFNIDDKGTITKLSKSKVPNYIFQAQPKDPFNLETYYELKARPIVFALVRQISNLRGIRTLAFDDDDDVALIPVIKPLEPVTIATVPTRRYAIRFGETDSYISSKELQTDSTAVAVFETESAARRFLNWFVQRSTAAGANLSDGLFLAASDIEKYGTHRFGLIDYQRRNMFKALPPTDVAKFKVAMYPPPPDAPAQQTK